MFQTLPQASKATGLQVKSTTLTATCPCHLFSGGSRLPFARLQMLQTPPQASKATTLTCRPLQTLPQASKATTLCPCHLFFRGFKTAVCPPSNAPNASAGLQGNNSYSYTATAIHALAICFSGGSRLPFARLQTLQTLPQASKATCLQVNNSYSYMPLPSVFQGVQDLPAFKCSKRLRRPPRQQLLQLHALCFSGGSRLPFACRPLQTSAGLQGNNSLPLPSVFQGVQDCRLPAFKCSKRLRRPPRQQLLQLYSYSYTCPSHLFFKGFKTAVCPPPNASAYLQASPIPPAGLQGNNCLPLPSVFQGVQDCRLPAFTCSKRLRRPPRQQLLQLYSYSYIYMPLPSVFQGVQDCRLPAFKCSKRFRRLPRQQASKSSQQLLQLHALAICFSGGSRLPFALFFRGPSNAPNASAGLQGNNPYLQASPNPPAGLQGNNSGPILVHKPHKPLVWYWINGINLFLGLPIICEFLLSWVLMPMPPGGIKRKNKEPTGSLGVYIYMCVNVRRLLPRPPFMGGRRHQGVSPFYNYHSSMIKPFRRTSCNNHDTFSSPKGMWPEMKWDDTHEMVPYS